jgi:excisionase family DNA binding protein
VIPKLLTEAEVADVLRISTRTLRTLRGKGEIRYILIGRKVLYAEEDCIEFIDRHAIRHAPRRLPHIIPFSARTRKAKATLAAYEEVLKSGSSRRRRSD